MSEPTDADIQTMIDSYMEATTRMKENNLRMERQNTENNAAIKRNEEKIEIYLKVIDTLKKALLA